MAQSTVSNIMLRANTALFAQKLSLSIAAMTSHCYIVTAETLSRGHFTYEGGGYIAFAHFSGKIQGDYIIAMHESTAAALAGFPAEPWPPSDIRKVREEYSGHLKEILNTAVHQALPELEKYQGPLTMISPSAVFGEMETPGITAGIVEINGGAGIIQCTVAINLITLRSMTGKSA